QTPHAVDAGALLHDPDPGAGQLHEVPALQADALGPEVAGRVVRDRLGHVAGEVEIEAGGLALVHPHQVLGGVVGMGRHQLGVGAGDVVDVVLPQCVAA